MVSGYFTLSTAEGRAFCPSDGKASADKLKRQISLMNLPLLVGITEAIWQVTSCSKIFEIGSRHLIHGRITTSPANHGTPERRLGLSKATPFKTGNRLDQAVFFGFMGNVSCPLALRIYRG